MKTYDKNLRYLKNNLTQVYDIVTKQKDLYEVKITELEGQNNCIVENENAKCYLHSVYDKMSECKKNLAQVDVNTGTLIVFGIGYGHAFDYIKQNEYNIENLIIIEPSIKIFKKFLSTYKIESLVKRIPKISFVLNFIPEDTASILEQMINDNVNTNIQFTYSISYRTLFNEYYNTMSSYIVKILRRERMNTVTNYMNTYKVLVNVMKNLKVEGLGMTKLGEFFREKPVVIVSAGPSLNKNIKVIQEAKNKAVIIAVGTAIEILEQNNITPHFRAAFSPNVDTTIFKKLNNYDVPLIYTNNLYFDILPDYAGPKFRLIADSDILSMYVYNKAKIENKTVISELSIANVIFEYLCNIGCENIILVGQDMAYDNGTMYAEGSLENINIDQEALIKDKDTEGNDIYTDTKFIGMRDALVRSINRNGVKENTVINTSEGGLNIPNTVYLTLSDKLNQMSEINDIETTIDFIVEQENNAKNDNLKDVIEAIFNIKKEVENVKEITEERIDMFRKALKMKNNGVEPNEILKVYEKINKFEQKMLSIPFYDQVIKYQLHGNYSTAIAAFKYNGSDQNKQVEAVESILMRTGVELKSYFEIFDALMKEYREEFKRFNLLSQEEIDEFEEELEKEQDGKLEEMQELNVETADETKI